MRKFICRAAQKVHKTLILSRFHKAIDPYNVLFLGDSISFVLGGKYNLARPGLPSDELLDHLKTADYRSAVANAGIVSILIGTNDLWQRRTQLNENLRKLDHLLPDQPIIWNGLCNSWPFDFAEIDRANDTIQRIVEGRTNSIYLHSPLASKRDFLADGVHLSARGISVWTNALSTVITGK